MSRFVRDDFRKEKGEGLLGGELSPGLGDMSRCRNPLSMNELLSTSLRSADCRFLRYFEVPFLIAATSSLNLFCTSGKLNHC